MNLEIGVQMSKFAVVAGYVVEEACGYDSMREASEEIVLLWV